MATREHRPRIDAYDTDGLNMMTIMRTRLFLVFTAGLAVLQVAGQPAGAANTDPNNATGTRGLVLVDKIGRHIRFLDPATRKELSNIDAAVAPHDLAIALDHKTMYVPIYGDGIYGRNPNPGHEIAIIDLETHKQTGSIDISPYQAPHGIQIDGKGLLYVTCDLSRKLLVVNPKTRAVEAAIDTEGTGHWVAVLPDGSKAYVANKNDRLFVTVIDLKTRAVVGHVPAPRGTQGIVASPDGKQVIAVDYGEPQLLVIDTATDKVVDTVQLDGNPRAFKPRYSPDGATLLVCNQGNGQINVLNARNLHAKQQVLPVGKDPMGLAFSADGTTALVANHGDGTVSVIDLRTMKVTDTFKAGMGIETLSYY
jgi:YVTN family beta-propeller protein